MNNLSQNTRRWVSVLNASGETIPPYGVVSIVVDDVSFSAPNEDPKRRLVGKKYKIPVALDYLQGAIPEQERVYHRRFAVNSRFAVPSEKFGMMYVGDGPVWVDYEEIDAAVFATNNLEVTLGPYHNSWTVNTNGFGFVPLRKPDVELGRVLCRMVPPETPQLFLVSDGFLQVVGQDGVDRYSDPPPEYGPYARCLAKPAHKTPDGQWRVDLNEYVVECTELTTVVCPPFNAAVADSRNKLWCRWQNGKFWAISGGGDFFPDAIALEAASSVAGKVSLVKGFSAQADRTVLASVWGCSNESVVANQEVAVEYDSANRKFWITLGCCPP